MKYVFPLFLICFFTGCDKAVPTVGAQPKTGFFESSKKWVMDKFKSEEKPSLTEEEKEALKQEAINKFKISDDLISTWIAKLDDNKKFNDGYVRHEGLTEVDAWDNFIKVNYTQDGFSEKVTVVSAGADGQFGTQDDLMRSKLAPKPFAFYEGLGPVGWCMFVWIATIPFSFLIMATKKKNKHPLIMLLLSTVAAPIYLILSIFSLVGCLGDFDFDID